MSEFDLMHGWFVNGVNNQYAIMGLFLLSFKNMFSISLRRMNLPRLDCCFQIPFSRNWIAHHNIRFCPINHFLLCKKNINIGSPLSNINAVKPLLKNVACSSWASFNLPLILLAHRRGGNLGVSFWLYFSLSVYWHFSSCR